MSGSTKFMGELNLPIRAAEETALAHGLVPDRCDILQNGSTLVLRLSETLVARVVTDVDGPRQGPEWFARENEVALHLAGLGAPVIPPHPEIPAGPHEHLGHTLNFWSYVQVVEETPEPAVIGRSLYRCHEILRKYPGSLPELAILRESLGLLEGLERGGHFPKTTLQLLKERLDSSIAVLRTFPHQALHGDAHPGNLLNTETGVLWTDWEDTFSGPVEWDVASIIWNARVLDEDHETADEILDAYRAAGGRIDPVALRFSMIARAAVMSAWYPILYPEPSPERRLKLQRRLEWLGGF